MGASTGSGGIVMKIGNRYQKDLGRVKGRARTKKSEAAAQERNEVETGVIPDQVNISGLAKTAAKSGTVVGQTPDIRIERVEEIRGQIEEGAYKVESDKVADKMVEEHLSDLT